VLEGLTLEFLGIAGRLTREAMRRSIPPSWLMRIREVLHDRFLESLRITELAAIAEVHPVHLARVFRAWYGVTPGIYLRQLRLEWASKELTGAGRASLSRIATAAGFADQSHFTRTFKQYFGVSPGRLRQENARSHPGKMQLNEGRRKTDVE
jgi:AraC family transcriptional regulator